MSGLISGLLQNSRALGSHMDQVQTAGRNIANVNNPDYARQRVNVGSIGSLNTGSGTVSMGLSTLGVEQIRDAVLDGQIISEAMTSGSLEAQLKALKSIEVVISDSLGEKVDLDGLTGATTDGTSSTGLMNYVDDFFLSFEELAATPNLATQKQVVLQKTEMVAEQLNLADQRLDAISDGLDQQVTLDVSEANQILDEISDLNLRISQSEVGGAGQAHDLRNQRQSKLEELGDYVNFEVSNHPSNSSMLNVVATDTGGNDVVLLNGGLVNNPLTYNATSSSIQVGAPAVDLDISGGSIYGALSVKTGELADVRAELDSFAEQLVTSANSVYNVGGTGDLFDATGITAASIAVDSSVTVGNLRSTNNAAGGNEIAEGLANLRNTDFSVAGGDQIDGTFNDHLQKLNLQIGIDTNSVEQKLDSQTVLQSYLETQRENYSGVSLDEEVADLIRFQRSYEATARVVRVMDDMLETLVNTFT